MAALRSERNSLYSKQIPQRTCRLPIKEMTTRSLNNHNSSSGYHTEKHNPLTCASSPKETTVRLRSYNTETPEAPSATLQMEAWAWHFTRSESSFTHGLENQDKEFSL